MMTTMVLRVGAATCMRRSIIWCPSKLLFSLQYRINHAQKIVQITTSAKINALKNPHSALDYPSINFEWPYPDFREPQRIWKLWSTISCFVVGWLGKAVLTVINTTEFNNLHILKDAIFRRNKDVPLITVSNHESCLDDPCLIGVLMTNRELLQQSKMRWGLAAHDICYSKPYHGWFMSRGKCPPIVRGLGVYQKSIDFVIDRLNEGNWFHIFPEGKVNIERTELHRLKWGVGRIISELEVPPIVIPFWHVGMPNILPNTLPYYPRIGKKVFINIGKPIDLTNVLKSIEGKKAIEKRKIITDVIQAEMTLLRLETIKLAKLAGVTCESESSQDQGKENGII